MRGITMTGVVPATVSRCSRFGGGCAATAFAELYQESQTSRVSVLAENSPLDMKDALKARGYRWSDGSDGRAKCWWIEVGGERA